MENTICTCTINTVCGDQTRQQTTVKGQKTKLVWEGFLQSVRTFGETALEIQRYNNDPEPVFSNGGTRVLIRPDRIDLI
jgi:hypothetical protein